METYESFEDLGAPSPDGEEAADAGDEQPIAGEEEDENEEEVEED